MIPYTKLNNIISYPKCCAILFTLLLLFLAIFALLPRANLFKNCNNSVIPNALRLTYVEIMYNVGTKFLCQNKTGAEIWGMLSVKAMVVERV